eukprot:6490640-Amphidinium_carterae.2
MTSESVREPQRILRLAMECNAMLAPLSTTICHWHGHVATLSDLKHSCTSENAIVQRSFELQDRMKRR